MIKKKDTATQCQQQTSVLETHTGSKGRNGRGYSIQVETTKKPGIAILTSD